MIRLAVVVEGRTEEEFVKELIATHLMTRGVETRQISLDGGRINKDRLVNEFVRLYHNFHAVTSLVDYYGFGESSSSTPEVLQERILTEVQDRIGSRHSWNPRRVVPYIQKYEFECLLFSDVTAFAVFPAIQESRIARLGQIRSVFSSPEDINSSYHTTPSRRIIDVIPFYDKVVHGLIVAEKIGLKTIRTQCPRFHAWLGQLESLQNLLSASQT